jgi:Secretion system C-terminal sorting domain/Right handed beta helix region
MKKIIIPAGFSTRLIAVSWIMLLCMYASELQAQTTRYVKPVSTGTGDGSSWANASNDFQWMINSSAYDDLIFVAAGTYKALSGLSYSMKEGVKIYGRFAGNETLLSQRNWTINVTILQGNGNSVIINLNNGLTTASVLDGFTITGGNGSFGGGMENHFSSPLIANCSFSGNSNSGMYNLASAPQVINCSFSGNTTSEGGGIYNNGSPAIITNCSFSGNSAYSRGGGVYNVGSSPAITNCTFSGNSAQLGGSMFNNLSTAVITNCGFSSNSASNNGGGIYNYATSFPSILNCTFLSNTAGITGGGMYSEPASAPTITGSLFTGNNTQFGGAMYNGGNATVTGCSFSNNWAASYGGAVYNGGLSPVYTNCIFSGNVAVNTGGGGGAMFNNNSTASIINNTFSGNAATFGGAIHNFNITSAFIRNTVIWGNSSGIYNESTAGALVDFTLIQGGYTGINNLNINPLFINAAVPAGADGIWGTTDDGLRPQVCSPIINAGNNSMITAGVVTDIAGHSRMQLVKVDMGAYEANSFANAAAANIATSNTVTSGWQIRDGQTFYSINCSTLAAAVTGDGTATSISGNTTAKVWIESSQPLAFVKRHYEITPQEVNPTTATGIITLYFTQAEFNDFNAVNAIKLPQGPADATGKTNLLIEKRGGISNNTTGLPDSYTGAIATINPDDANIIWNATNLRWEISFPVTGFSGFFVKTYSFTLPLRLVSFSAEENNCITTLQWTTKDEINVSHFEAEQSSDGISFNIIKTIPAKNTGIENKYTITVPVINDRMFYRLKMVDIDGKITYSQVRIITSACGNKILVTPNPAIDRLYIRNASVGSQYVIYDNTGKRVGGGRIFNTAQEVFITSIAPGIYYISITDKNGSNKKVSFLKE